MCKRAKDKKYQAWEQAACGNLSLPQKSFLSQWSNLLGSLLGGAEKKTSKSCELDLPCCYH